MSINASSPKPRAVLDDDPDSEWYVIRIDDYGNVERLETGTMSNEDWKPKCKPDCPRCEKLPLCLLLLGPFAVLLGIAYVTALLIIT